MATLYRCGLLLAMSCLTGCLPPQPAREIVDAGGSYGALVTGPARIEFDVDETSLTDADLKRLAPVIDADRRYTELQLDQSSITDASVPTLLSLKRLRVVRIAETQVSFDGIKALATNPHIIWIAGSPLQITPRQLRELTEMRPDLAVFRYFRDKQNLEVLQEVADRPDEQPHVRDSCQKSIKEGWYLPDRN